MPMRPDRKALFYSALVLAALLLALLVFPWTASWFRAKEFEWKARSKLDPAKLQAWATNLLHRFPPERGFYLDLFGTNLPPGAAEMNGYPHPVSIVVGEEKVPRVVLFGALGDPAILVGSTDFVSQSPETSLWKPGIYFRKPRR
jgi:hypothetical protein